MIQWGKVDLSYIPLSLLWLWLRNCVPWNFYRGVSEHMGKKKPGQVMYLIFRKTSMRFRIKIIKKTEFPWDCKKSYFIDWNLNKCLDLMILFQDLEILLVGSNGDQCWCWFYSTRTKETSQRWTVAKKGTEELQYVRYTVVVNLETLIYSVPAGAELRAGSYSSGRRPWNHSWLISKGIFSVQWQTKEQQHRESSERALKQGRWHHLSVVNSSLTMIMKFNIQWLHAKAMFVTELYHQYLLEILPLFYCWLHESFSIYLQNSKTL